MKNISIGVIGAGKWGQALHFALNKNQKTYIYSRTYRQIDNFVSLEEILNCQYLIITIPVQQIQSWLSNNFVFKNQKVLVASKGIEVKSKKFLNEIYDEFIPKSNIGFISGPSFASEVMKSLPTAIVINSINEDIYKEFNKFFPSFIKIYYSSDIVGAQITGAYKNVIAIAAGICEGLNLGNNAKASLISRGLVEMYRFGKFFKAKEESFLGLSGSGDLFLTANSKLSRNFTVGLNLAKNRRLEDILNDLGQTAEGVKTSQAIYELAKKHNIYTPIANEVKLILDGKIPQNSLKDLLNSASKV